MITFMWMLGGGGGVAEGDPAEETDENINKTESAGAEKSGLAHWEGEGKLPNAFQLSFRFG